MSCGQNVRLVTRGQLVEDGNPLPVTIAGLQVSTPPSSSAPKTAGGDIATLAAGGKLFIQNLGVNPLYVKRGTGAAASTSFNYVLPGGVANDDGLGGVLTLDDWIGVVSVAGTSPRFSAW